MSNPEVRFEVLAEDGNARAGRLQLPRGAFDTPVFMPVGTQATVKALDTQDLEALDVRVLLSNAYHLGLRPGAELVEKLGGLHNFMGWDRLILTDSGGSTFISEPGS